MGGVSRLEPRGKECYNLHMLEFRILGPLEVVDDQGPLKLGGLKQRALLAMLFAGFIGLIILQAGCSSSRSTNITTGTPAGTYPLTITSTSGSASRTFPIALVVN